jgi:cellulose synthase/poly-beta-1,6-N-acetylglucosamine synthase-like glycosyltransferase
MIFEESLDLLSQLDATGFILLFWFTVIFELPRYFVSGVVVAAAALLDRSPPDEERPARTSVSVIVAGYNEAESLPSCIASIREQTIMEQPGGCQIVVVDDGSYDAMTSVASNLQAQGKIDVLLSMRHRGGKSAAVNLGVEYCSGEIVIVADADTSFDRRAFEEMVKPFADPAVGAVAGNLGVRNAGKTLLTQVQEIEYLIGVSLGRRLLSIFDTLLIVSGAFGAFRRSAIHAVGGQSVEVGEDADLTAKIRRAGWKVRFAEDAWSLTDAPETFRALLGQRMRWDRSTITLWVRKFRSLFDPRSANFSITDVLGAADLLFFQIGLSVTFGVYLVWLFWNLGSFAWIILATTMIIYAVLATLTYLTAIAVSPGHGNLRNLVFVPAYAIMTAYPLRLARVVAYLDELIFRRSYRDPYVPRRVMDQVERF